MPTRNINLTNHYDEFVEKQISSGRFQNASEVLRAGLSLLERQAAEDKEKIKVLRSLVRDAKDQFRQGHGIELQNDTELNAFISGIGRRVRERAKSRSRQK